MHSPCIVGIVLAAVVLGATIEIEPIRISRTRRVLRGRPIGLVLESAKGAGIEKPRIRSQVACGFRDRECTQNIENLDQKGAEINRLVLSGITWLFTHSIFRLRRNMMTSLCDITAISFLRGRWSAYMGQTTAIVLYSDDYLVSTRPHSRSSVIQSFMDHVEHCWHGTERTRSDCNIRSSIQEIPIARAYPHFISTTSLIRASIFYALYKTNKELFHY